jgi:periplasmic divalent cation tolerance protein
MSLLMIRIACPTQRVAHKIADEAVEKRLAACANVEGPVQSTYRWKGVVEQAFEFILWLKAPEANWDRLEALVRDIHPYKVPAMTATVCAHVTADYAAWVEESTDT